MADTDISMESEEKATAGETSRPGDEQSIRSMQANFQVVTKDDSEPDESGEPKKSHKKVILLLVALLTVGAAGGGAWMFLLQPPEAEAEIVEAAPEIFPRSYIRADPVHIAFEQTDGRHRQLVVYLVLEVEQRDGHVAKVQSAMPRLQEAYWRVLNGDPLPGASTGAIELTTVKDRVLAESEKLLGPKVVNDILIRKARAIRG